MTQQISSGQSWREEERVLALDLYLRCRREGRYPTHDELSRHLELLAQLGMPRRTHKTIDMKMSNFANLDSQNPDQGLDNASYEDRRIWREYAGSHARLDKEVLNIKQRVVGVSTARPSLPKAQQQKFTPGLERSSGSKAIGSGSSGRRWRVEETVLALELYLRCQQERRYPNPEEISQHRDLLWRLGMPFRNANTINLKMHDFAGIDAQNPDPGLKTASSQDRRIWRELASAPRKLQQEVTRIKGGKS